MATGTLPLSKVVLKKIGRARLDELCEFAPVDGEIEELVLWLVRFVEWLRPTRDQRIGTKTKFLEMQLEQHPEWRTNVGKALARLVDAIDLPRFLAYGGIPTDFHLGGAIHEWWIHRALPSACKTDHAAEIVRLAFRDDDRAWLRHRPLVRCFADLVGEEGVGPHVVDALGEALGDLAHQIVAQAHAPAVRALDTRDRSPYRGLYDAVTTFVAAPEDDGAHKALQGRIQQCVLLLHSHRGELAARGASLNATFQLRRLQEQIDRLSLLATVLHSRTQVVVARTFNALVDAVLEHGNGKRLFRRSADLLVQNVVDSAATVGRAYLDDSQSTWRAAFVAGAGGGVLMVVATIVKYLLTRLELPELYEGLAFSLNYAAIFCAAYLLHYTIATKLPANTAAALARSAQEGIGHRERLVAFVEVWRATIRLQIAGLLGNLVVAAPLAYGVDIAVQRLLHRHILTPELAHHALTMSSALGPSIVYAALTGVFLWVSSLIGALGANWTHVVGLSDRLATNVHVLRRFRREEAKELVDPIVGRVGGLVGNASLGFMMGGIPALFAIARLPIEIRHITVSTSSVALAVAEGAATRSTLGLALAGLVVIAIVNVGTSFALALWLALRATRGMRASASSLGIVRLGMTWWRRPLVHAPKRDAKPKIIVEPVEPVTAPS